MNFNLKIARMKKNMSQNKLCKITGISRSALSQYENGKANPSLKVMKKLSKALGVSVTELFFDENE